ncbi:MAG: hypothetical protein OXE53_15485, partial [Deltaproteobacteria bacterium]|nr:hypothetical protein [Deltaproteobacteria bacterium]
GHAAHLLQVLEMTPSGVISVGYLERIPSPLRSVSDTAGQEASLARAVAWTFRMTFRASLIYRLHPRRVSSAHQLAD